jgi:hypothetical protein
VTPASIRGPAAVGAFYYPRRSTRPEAILGLLSTPLALGRPLGREFVDLDDLMRAVGGHEARGA